MSFKKNFNLNGWRLHKQKDAGVIMQCHNCDTSRPKRRDMV
jgi:hypothetical protein